MREEVCKHCGYSIYLFPGEFVWTDQDSDYCTGNQDDVYHEPEEVTIMNHEPALNLMLAHNCPQQERKEDGINTFYFEGHCMAFTVKAKLIPTIDEIKYEIISIELDDN